MGYIQPPILAAAVRSESEIMSLGSSDNSIRFGLSVRLC